MIYIISDLHGYPLESVKALLEKVGFGENDFLYVLGDVIDRGEEGIQTLLWMMSQSNVELILGNHEAMMLSCEFILDEVDDSFVSNLTSEKMSLLRTWQWNGAAPTIKALTSLPKTQRKYIFEYLHEAPLYEALTVASRDLVLTHSGYQNFDKSKRVKDYLPDELLWNRPKMTDRYFEDIITVFGHTPTCKFGSEHAGKILRTDTWIDIDAGAANGYSPALLCLDTMQEYYTQQEEKENG